jgi:steroid 5-alpha reductase family enzyme
MNYLLTTLAIAILLNLFVFVFAFKNQTDKLTDITYALTFIALALFGWYTSEGRMDVYKLTLLFMVGIWAFRLGSYLFFRVMIKGKDHRFDEFRHNFKRYLRFWVLQGLSVWLISIPFLIALGKPAEEVQNLEGNSIVMIGMLIWVVGFVIEAISDRQKFKFRLDQSNDGQFMNKGLFSIIRYPNYLGEMMVWIGIFITAVPLLVGLEWLSILSPLWICVLLLFISGIPFLERSNKKRYGHLESFQKYKAETSKLIPYIY